MSNKVIIKSLISISQMHIFKPDLSGQGTYVVETQTHRLTGWFDYKQLTF